MTTDPRATSSGVIDAHVHIFSPETIRDRVRVCSAEPWFGMLYEMPAARLSNPVDLMAAMDVAGVDVAIAAGFPWRDLGRARHENDFLAESCGLNPDRLNWLANVPTVEGGPAAREVERAFVLGALGVGEINADAQGVDLLDPSHFAEVAEVCVAANRPVMLHASEPVGHHYPGKGLATPDRLLALITAFPALKFVLAHWGGGLPFYELMPEVATACARVVYDTAASTYLYRPGVFRTVLDIVGRDRVLWGSDYPVLGMARFLGRTRDSSGLQDSEVDQVLGSNARRVYGIGGGDTA